MEYKKYHIKRLLRELQTNISGSDSSSNEYQYVNFVEAAINNQEVFNSFRNDSRYRDILEHVSDELGKKYYFNLREELSHKEIVDLCKSVKNVGSPQLSIFEDSELNPTTLRYINVGLDLRKKFSKSKFENIVEIGAGYGGQALILDNFFEIKKYTFIDLPQVNQLIKKFLSYHQPKFNYLFSEITSYKNKEKYDLFISNYAFSELPKKLQITAIKNIVSYTEYGYMIVNNFNDLSFRYLNKAQYSTYLKDLKIFNEIPESYIFNKVLTFKF
tara:strand:+ start:1104 stop:1919 length:816 start_codon:yes stop_codon:yes gene_type:complete